MSARIIGIFVARVLAYLFSFTDIYSPIQTYRWEYDCLSWYVRVHVYVCIRTDDCCNIAVL